MTSLSGLAVNLGVVAIPSVGCAWFEFLLPLRMASGVVVLGEVVSVSAWAAWEAPELAGKVGHLVPLVRTECVNANVSG